MATDNRALYLQALLNSKKTSNANGNPIINPSLSNDIAQQASLKTVPNLSSTAGATKPDTQEENWGWLDWARQAEGATQNFENAFRKGFLGFFEGIADFGANIVSTIADQAGNHEMANNINGWIAKDWSGEAMDWYDKYANFSDLITTGNSIKNWIDVGNGRSPSVISTGFKTDFGKTVGDLAGSVGNMLPSIIIGGAVGGATSGAVASGTMKAGTATLVTKGASLGAFGLGASGAGSQKALQEGATSGQALAYGATEGAIEVGTELLSDGIGKVATNLSKPGAKLAGNKVVEWLSDFGYEPQVAQKVIGGMSLSKIAKVAFEEGTEEFEGAMIEPIALSIYKGDQSSQYKDPAFWLDASKQFASGATIGVFMDGVSNASQNAEFGGAENANVIRDYADNMEQYQSIKDDYKAGKMTLEQAESLSEPYLQALKNDAIKISGFQDEYKQKFVDIYTNPNYLKQEMERLKATESTDTLTDADIRSKAYAQTFDKIQKDVSSDFQTQVINDFNSVDAKSHIATESELDTTTDATTGKTLRELFDSKDNTVNKSYRLSDGTIVYNPKYSGEIASLVAHESLGHAYMDSDPETRRAFVDDIKSDPKLKTKLESLDSDILKQYHTEIMKEIQSDYSTRKAWENSDQYGRKHIEMSTDTFQSEQVANFIQKEVGNFNDLERIAQGKGKSFAKRLLEAMGKKSTMLDSEAQNRIANAIKVITGTRAVDMRASLNPISYAKDVKEYDATATVSDIEELSDYRTGAHVTMAGAKEIIRYAYSQVLNETKSDYFSLDASMNGKLDKLTEALFRNGNLITDEAELKKSIASIADAIVSTDVKVNTDLTGTKAQYSTFNLTDETIMSQERLAVLRNQLSSDIEELLKANTIASKNNAMVKARVTISILNDKVLEEVNRRIRTIESVKVYKDIKHLQEDFKSERGQSFEILKNDTYSNVLRNMVGSAQFGTKSGLLSASYKVAMYQIVSDPNFAQAVNDMKYITNGDALVSMAKEIASWCDTRKGKDGKFVTQAPFTATQLETISDYLQNLKYAYEQYKANKIDEVKKSFGNSDLMLKVLNKPAKDTYLDRIKNGIYQEIAYSSSIETFFKGKFGDGSQAYKIMYGDIMEAHKQQIEDSIAFYENQAMVQQKYKKVYKREGNYFTYRGFSIPKSELYDIYVQSVINPDVLTDGGYEIFYGKRSKGYSQVIKFSQEDVAKLSEILTPSEKDYAMEIAGIYDKLGRDYKKNADIANIGYYNEVAGRYYPVNRGGSLKFGGGDGSKYLDTFVQSWTGNKQRTRDTGKPIKGDTITTRFNSYVDGLTRYGAMTKPMYALNLFLNTNVKGTDVTRESYMAQSDPLFTKMIDFYRHQLFSDGYNDYIDDSNIVGNVVKSMLFASPSVVFKQIGSAPTMLKEVRYSSWLKGFAGLKNINPSSYNEIVAKLSHESGILYSRFANHEAITSQTLHHYANTISDVLGIPMEKMDQAVIVTLGMSSAQYEAEARGYGAVGTQENYKQAVKILEDIVLETQSNTDALMISPNRAGATGVVRKALSYFSSDLNNAINWWNEVILGKAQSGARIKAYQSAIDSGTYSDSEVAEFNKLIQSENTRYDSKTWGASFAKMASSFVMKGLIMALIQSLMDRIKGKKQWGLDEESTKDFFKDFAFESTVYNMPYVSSIVNAVNYDSDLGLIDFETLNNIKDSFVELNKGIKNGWDTGKITRFLLDLSDSLVSAFGFPIKNLRTYTMALWRLVDAQGEASAESVLYGYSSTYAMSKYNEAIKDGGLFTAKGYLGYAMSAYKVKSDDDINAEIARLGKAGYSAIPSDAISSYDNDKGEEVRLSTQEQATFRQDYDKSYQEVKDLLKTSQYRQATDEEKAGMIKRVYSAYYSYAKAKASKSEPTTRVAKLLYYSNGSIKVGALIAIAQALAKLVATGTKTRSDLAVAYVNKLDMPKGEKLLILFLAGFNVTDTSTMESYLKSVGVSDANAKALLGIKSK